MVPTIDPASDPTRRLPDALQDPALAARFRRCFVDAGYGEPGIRALLGLRNVRMVDGGLLPLLCARAAGEAPLAVLVRLFFLGLAVPEGAAAAALLPTPLREWEQAGFLAVADGQARPLLQVAVYEHLLLLTDLRQSYDLPADTVMGLAGTTLHLCNLTPRRPVGRVLDVGTGCGLQALLAAAHAQEVVATDINPRALGYARANALLNDLHNIHFRQGSLYEPVAGERFDLIISNPPFVISPDAAAPRYLFRDGGLAGDGLSERLARGAAEHLNEGGVCQFLCGWLSLRGQDPAERVRGWVADGGCDAWVMLGQAAEPAEYTVNWIRQTERDDPALRWQLHQRWMAYFQAQEVEALCYGMIVLQRRAAGTAPWFSFEDAAEDVGPSGDAVLRGLALRGFLHDHIDDDALLQARLRAAPELRVQRTLVPAPVGFQIDEDEVFLKSGLSHRAQIGGPLLALLADCRGGQTLYEVMASIATNLRLPLPILLPGCLPIARDLVRQGMLLPESVT